MKLRNILNGFIRKPKKEPVVYDKVFGIGYPKTGSTSLAVALRQLGFNTLHDESCVFPKALMVGDVITTSIEFDACVNIHQWLFKRFDELYPNSKFILTTRSEESWWWSIRWWRDLGTVQAFDSYIINDAPHMLRQPKQLADLEMLFGYFALFKCFGVNERLYRTSFRQHNINVVDYFKDTNRLLVLPLESENKFQLLAEFLNKPVPQELYPFEKQGTQQYIN